MKKIISYILKRFKSHISYLVSVILILVSCFVILFTSCKKIDNLNKDTKNPTSVPGEYLFTGAQQNLFYEMVNSNVNFNIWRLIAQYWTETTYLDEANYNLVERTIPDNHWLKLYRDALENFYQAKSFITATAYPEDPSPSVKINKLAIIDVMEAYTFSILVETFGNVPYTQALNINVVTPKYDDGLTIYEDLINRLTNDISTMTANNDGNGSFGAADNMYQGNVTEWIKFAASLKLRMGMLLSDCDPAFAKTAVESAVPNVFTSNADNAMIIYQSSQPNTNPIYVDLVASGRHDFVPANTIVDTMNGLKDPREAYYFTLDSGVYKGGVYGQSSPYSEYSGIAPLILTPTFPGTIMDYAEVQFLLAEGVERGYAISGSAESYYDNAITASMQFWGVPDSSTKAYLANPAVAYSTAQGTYKQKIGFQQWLAYYNRGFEAWTEWRKMGFPVLHKPAPPAAPKSDVPVRYTYPIEEQTLNLANYQAASAAIGGDYVSTKLFFQKSGKK